MKIPNLILLFLCFFSIIYGQSSPDQLFAEAEQLAIDNKFLESNEKYKEATALYLTDANWPQYYQCRYAVTYNFLDMYSFDEAKEEIEQAITHFEKNYRDTFILQEAKLYHAAGQVFKDLHQYDEAIAYNRLAMQAYQGVKDSVNRMKFTSYMLNNIGSVYKVKRSMDSALYYFELALPLKVQSMGATANSTIRTIKAISGIYQDWGQLEKAIKTQTIALNAALETGNKDAEAQAYNGLSQMYQRKRDFESSKMYISKSMEIYRKMPTFELDLAHSYHQMGNVLEGERSHDESIQWYTTAKGMYRKIHNGKYSYQEGNSTMNLGKAHNYMAAQLEASSLDIDATHPEVRALRAKAIEYYEENERIFEASVSKDHARWIELWLSKGVCLLENLDSIGAHALFQKAYERAYLVAPEKSYDRSLSCLNLARTTKNNEEAIALHQQGLWELSHGWEATSIADNPSPEEVFYEDWSVQIMLNKVERVQQIWNYQKDVELLHSGISSINAADALLDESRASFLTTSAKINLGSKGHNVYSKGVELCYELGSQEEEAFHYIEKDKSLVLLEALQSGKRIHDVMIPDSISSKLQRISAKIAELTAFQNQFVNSDKYTEIGAQIFDLEQERKELKARIEELYPLIKRISDQGQTMKLSEVQSTLSDNEVIYEYSFTNEFLYILKIQRNSSKLYKANVRGFQKELDALLDMISDEDIAINESNSPAIWDAYQENAFHLFQQLLPDFKGEDLLIIPDGKLNYLPFELLLTAPKSQDQINFGILPYLIKLATIKYAFSSSLHFAKVQVETKGQQSLLAFAPSYPASPSGLLASRAGFTSLAHTETEAMKISTLMRGDSYIGREATVEKFKENVSDYKVLHLAMHAYTHDKDPMLSGMVFSETETDNILHAHELYNMKIPSELVVLSACNTGLGQYNEGEGVMSLGRAFRHAGTENVVMSLWQANDASTSDVMTKFYENLDDGMSKAKALRAAKLAYLESSTNVFPYFWSPFVLLGDDEPLELSGGWNRKWMFAGIGILMIIGLGLSSKIKKKRA